MGMNLDAIGDSFDWKIKGNIFGSPFEWIGKLRVTTNTRRTELQTHISRYAHLLRTNPGHKDVEKMGPLAIAKELLMGWVDPDGEIVYNGEPLASTPENVSLVLDRFPGVEVAVCLAWFEAANGEEARLGNSNRSPGFGVKPKQVANGKAAS